MIALLLAWLLVAAAGPEGDPAARDKQVRWERPERSLDLALAYRGSGWTLVHPGLAVRAETALVRRDMTVEHAHRKLGFRHRTREVFLGGELGADMHVNNHTLLTLHGLVGTRVTRTRGSCTGPTLSTGVTRAVLNHPSWQVKEDGTVARQWLQGQWSHSVSLAYELGWDSQRRRETRIRRGRTTRPPLDQPRQWFVRPTLTLLTPWMDLAAVPTVHVDVGLRAGAPAWGLR